MKPKDCQDSVTGIECSMWRGVCTYIQNQSEALPPTWCPFKKSSQAAENAPGRNRNKSPIPNQENNPQYEISGVTPKSEPCPCGCGRIPEGRKGKVYYSRHCKDIATNRARLDALKRIKRLAVATRVMAKMTIKLADSIYPDPFKRGGG